jgi:hypothetical protein
MDEHALPTSEGAVNFAHSPELFAHSPELIDRMTEKKRPGAGGTSGPLIERRRRASDAATKAITSGSDGRGHSLAELKQLIGTKCGARG